MPTPLSVDGYDYNTESLFALYCAQSEHKTEFESDLEVVRYSPDSNTKFHQQLHSQFDVYAQKRPYLQCFLLLKAQVG